MADSQHITIEQIKELHERIAKKCGEMNDRHNSIDGKRPRYQTTDSMELDLEDVAILDVALNVLVKQIELQKEKN